MGGAGLKITWRGVTSLINSISNSFLSFADYFFSVTFKVTFQVHFLFIWRIKCEFGAWFKFYLLIGAALKLLSQKRRLSKWKVGVLEGLSVLYVSKL